MTTEIVLGQSRSRPVPRLRNVVEAYLASRHLPYNVHPGLDAVATATRASWLNTVGQSNATSSSLVPSTVPIAATSTALYEDEGAIDELYQDAESWRKAFQQALIEYERKAPEKAKTFTNIQSHHSWEDVLELTDSALDTYNDTTGFSGKMKKVLRRLSQQTDMLTAWSSFLPSQSEYFSILCGGLKMIITAAARLRHICDELTTALEEIPSLLSCVHGTLTAFKSSRELHRCSADFYVSLVACMNCMVGYLTKRSITRFVGAVFKVEGFAKDITDHIKEVRRRSVAFDRCATRCSYAIAAHTHDLAKKTRFEGQQAQLDNTRSLADIRREQYDQSSAIYYGMRSGQEQILFAQQWMRQEIGNEMQQQVQGLGKKLEVMLGNTWKAFLASNDKVDPRSCTLRSEAVPLRRRASDPDELRRRSRLVKASLLKSLEYDDAITSSDLVASLRHDYSVRLRSEDRVTAIMEAPRLRAWLAGPVSDVLFINGNHVASEHQPPTSFVSAKLVSTIQQGRDEQPGRSRQGSKPAILSLSYFCARHKHPKDLDAGPDGMLRNLLAQLLITWPDFDLTAIERLRDIDNGNIDDLLSMFETLVDQIPAGVIVFCIVDAVTIMEDRTAWKEGANMLIGALAQLAQRHHADSHCLVKLLITSPTESRSLYKQVPKHNVIWMPEKVPQRGPTSDYTWKHGVAQQLEGSSRDLVRLARLGDHGDDDDDDE